MKLKLSLFISIFFTLILASSASAKEVSKLGIHIMNTSELKPAEELLTVEGSDEWQYVTIPFTLDDIHKSEEWQEFFDKAQDEKIIPLVRLATRVEDGAWQRPTRREIVLMISVLSQLDWPTSEKHIIIFNEVNHAKEWGGKIDPEGYAETLEFASNWARSENENYLIMPAAMDLAAPNGSETQEAFSYLNEMYESNKEIFQYVDAWNSHSYPNPGFSSAPQRTGKNSLRGFEHELAYLKEKTDKDFEVYITETGWEDNSSTSRWLAAYYNYAMQHIWSNPQVKAVTPFVLKGAPGPFADFSFLSDDDKPTRQYFAFRYMIESLAQQQRLLTDAALE